MSHTEIIEVFKTNVQDRDKAGRILNELHGHFPNCKFNFDLDDCDKILRAEGDFIVKKIIGYMNKKSFRCEVLE
jgi:hypothetical protein